MVKPALACCALLCLGAAVAADAALELPDPLVIGVELGAQITVRDPPAAPRTIAMPQVPGLRWGDPRHVGTRQSITDAGRQVSYSYLVPVRAEGEPGELAIPSATVTLADGSTLATPPMQVQLAKPDPTLVGDGRAEAAFEPDRVVPGQPTTLVLRVYTRAQQQLQPGIAPPAEALPLGEMAQSVAATVAADGSDWFIATFRWPLAFSQPGTHTAQGQQLVLVPTGRRDFFGQREGVRRQLPIRPGTITVAALPEEGRPPDFTGLVGEITATATLDRERIAAGEGVQLALVVRGRQLDLLRPPQPAWPAGIQAYAKPAQDGAGERIYRWDLVPAAPGSYRIPGVGFPWFDAATRTYRRTSTPDVALEVIPGRSRDLAVGGRLPTADPIAAAPAAATAITLPPPLRGGPSIPHPQWAVWAGAAGLVLGLLGGLGLRLAGRARRGPHRGLALRAALAGGDAAAIAAALAALAAAELDAPRRAALAAAAAALDRHRFGGEPLPADFAERLRGLEDVP